MDEYEGETEGQSLPFFAFYDSLLNIRQESTYFATKWETGGERDETKIYTD